MTGNEVSARIKERRKEQKLTQQELADKIGVSLMTVLRWEKGERTPNTSIMPKLSSALNVSAGYLMGMEEKPDRRKDISEKEKDSIQERNTNMAVIALKDGNRVEAPATPEGYAFLERLFLASLGTQAVATA